MMLKGNEEGTELKRERWRGGEVVCVSPNCGKRSAKNRGGLWKCLTFSLCTITGAHDELVMNCRWDRMEKLSESNTFHNWSKWEEGISKR